MKFAFIPMALVLTLSILGGCASSPTWSGMSETEISGWRALGLEAADAQALSKAGVSLQDTQAWRDAGLRDTKSILAWHDRGWSAGNAKDWLAGGFDLDTASAWYKQKFSAEQARAWITADFSLKEAVSNRDKGLTPVR